MIEYDIAIIGGGPAGISAAIACRDDLNVVLLEKNSKLGVKLLMTGGGRCNITNNKPLKKLLNIYGEKNFLKHSFYTFTNEDLFSLLDMDLTEEDDNRIFPKSGKASDVLKSLENHLSNVTVKLNYNVYKISDEFIINDEIKAKKIIIATGGVTYPQTGCSKDNYFLTAQPLTKIRYGLAPLKTRDDLSSIAGITLYDVNVSYKKNKVNGNVLITHNGLTGPGIINLSNLISKDLNYNILEDDNIEGFTVNIDLCPDYTHEELKSKFLNDFNGRTLLKNYLKLYLTGNFIEYFLAKSCIDGNVQLSRVDKKAKNRLIESLKRFSFEIVGFNKNLSKITIGGFDLNYINPKSMESKLTQGLYFAGETLDLDAPTGGYNLKIAFSTGYLAGKSAGSKLL